MRVLSHVVADVKTALEILEYPERSAVGRYNSLNPSSHRPALGFHYAGVTFRRFCDCLRIAGFRRACANIART